MKPVRVGSVCVAHPCVPMHGVEQTLETHSVKLINQNNISDTNCHEFSYGKRRELGSPRPKPRCQLLQQAALASPVTALGLSFLLLKISSIIPPLRVMPESPALCPTRTEVLNKWWLAEHHKDTHTLTVKPPLSADRGQCRQGDSEKAQKSKPKDLDLNPDPALPCPRLCNLREADQPLWFLHPLHGGMNSNTKPKDLLHGLKEITDVKVLSVYKRGR